MTQTLPHFDIFVLALYLLGTVAFGLWMGRRSGTPDNFMVAGGNLPAWAVGLSIFGTFVSSISFLALTGKGVGGNWNPFVFSLTIPLAAWIAVKAFVPFYRRSGTVSAYEHLEHRFGPWARLYGVACYLLTQLGRMGTIMYLVALAFSPLTGWSMRELILVVGVIVVVYSMLGGITAVIWADVVQSIVLIGGAVACVVVLLTGMPEGPGQLFAIAQEHGKFSLGSFTLAFSTSTFWVVLLYGVCMNLTNFGIDQSYVQRYHTARSEAEARRSVWGGGLLYLPVSAFFLFIGTGLFAFYTARPERLPVHLNFAKEADKVFPHFIVAELPVGLTGLVIAAIFAAAQSTMSSTLNCSATLISCDIYRRHFRPKADEKSMMWVLRGSTLVVGLLGTLTALAMINSKSALDVWWEWSGIVGGGVLGLFLLGMIARKAQNAAGVTGVSAGILVIIWMTVSTKDFWPPAWAGWKSPFHSFMTAVVGTSTILLTGFLLTLMLKPRSGRAGE